MSLAAAALWWNIREFTPIVVLAVLLAYALNPLIELASRALRVGRAPSVLFVYLTLFIIILFVPLFLAPGVLGAFQNVDLVGDLNKVADELFAVLPSRLAVFGRSVDLGARYAELKLELQRAVSDVFGRTSLAFILGFATDFAFTIFGLFVTFVASIYIALDAPGIVRWVEHFVPEGYDQAYAAIRRDIDHVWRRFFRGELILALTVGSVTTLGLLVLGLPLAVPLGIVAGVLEVLPRVGPVLATVPAMAVAMVTQSSTIPGFDGFWFVISVTVFYILVQNLENSILVPRILGSSVNLPPAVVLVGALAGAKLAGVAGILLAAPILGSLRVMGSWLYWQITRDPQAGRPPTSRGAPHEAEAEAEPAAIVERARSPLAPGRASPPEL